MLQNPFSRLLLTLRRAIEIGSPFLSVGQMILLFKNTNDRHHCVVMTIARQALLDLSGRRFAQPPDNAHDLQLSIGKSPGRLSRHAGSIPYKYVERNHKGIYALMSMPNSRLDLFSSDIRAVLFPD